jgi:hypothetical protein
MRCYYRAQRRTFLTTPPPPPRVLVCRTLPNPPPSPVNKMDQADESCGLDDEQTRAYVAEIVTQQLNCPDFKLHPDQVRQGAHHHHVRPAQYTCVLSMLLEATGHALNAHVAMHSAWCACKLKLLPVRNRSYRYAKSMMLLCKLGPLSQ